MPDAKLTLRLDAEAIAAAKRVAAERGTSVSALVERYFRALAPPSPSEGDGSLADDPPRVYGPITSRLMARKRPEGVYLPMTPEDDSRLWHEHLDGKYGR